MKLINFALGIGLFATLFSCSMEDDVLNGKETYELKPAIEEGDAYIGVSVDMQTLAKTKGDTGLDTELPNDREKAITSCSMILLEGDKVLIADDHVYVNSNNVIVKSQNGQDTLKYMVKVKTPSPYKVMVIANSDKKFENHSTLASIQGVLQDNKEALVKVGTGNVVFQSGFQGYTSTKEACANPVMAEPVKVEQLTARIDLNSFNVVEFIDGSDPMDVIVKSVTLTNLNTTIYTGNAYENSPKLKSETYTFKDGGCKVFDASAEKDKQHIALTEIPHFYTFSNQLAETPVTMSITYTVGDVEYTTTNPYVINKPGNSPDHQYVKSSTLYKVNVNMSLRSGITFTTNVLDWVNVNLDVEF